MGEEVSCIEGGCWEEISSFSFTDLSGMLLFVLVFVASASSRGDHAAFYSWAKSNGVVMDGIEINTNSQGRRGVFSTKPLRKGAEVLRVHRPAMLVPLYENNLEVGRRIVPLYEEGLSQNEELALLLLGSRGGWFQPYLDLLPEVFDTPLFWERPTLELLNGSHVVPIMTSRSQRLEARFASVIQPAFAELTLAEFRWAYSIALSRSFLLKVNDIDTKGFVPMADFFNFGTHSSIRVEMSKGDVLSYRLSRDVPQGVELGVSYGNRVDNFKLLTDYGFVASKVPTLALVYLGEFFNEIALGNLRDALSWEGTCQVSSEQFPHRLLNSVRFLLATPQERALVERLKNSQPLSVQNEQAALIRCQSILAHRLAEYQAKDVLEKAAKSASTSERLAAQYALAEKDALRKALRFIGANLEEFKKSEL